MELVIVGVLALGLVGIICHAARHDDGTRSRWRNMLSQLMVTGGIVVAAAAVIWVGTYGN